MRAYVGVTDANWASFLASRPALTEVNFWKPGGQGSKALAIGEPFAFKTHYPHNQVVGVGFRWFCRDESERGLAVLW